MVRAKTPKITFYSTKAKCDLMESLENFEMSFYDGAKIIQSHKNQIKIIDNDGNPMAMTCVINGNEQARALWIHYQQCIDHCRLIEQTLSGMQCDADCFPVIIGRKPSSVPVLSISKNQSNNLLTPRLPNVC